MNELLKGLIRIGQELQPVADHVIREFARSFAQALVEEVRDKWQEQPGKGETCDESH